MKKVIITENQRGFLTQNGKFVKMLNAGKYRVGCGREIEVIDIDGKAMKITEEIPLSVLQKDENFVAQTVTADCKNGEFLFHFVNGVYCDLITEAGVHVFWSVYDKHTFEAVDIMQPEIPERFLKYVGKIPGMYYTRVNVFPHDTGLLYFNHVYQKTLEAGHYYYWSTFNNVDISVEHYPCGLVSENVVGQEILTSDKVSLRINCVCNYRINDCVALAKDVGEEYDKLLHNGIQLALREYVSKYTIDQILENKQAMGEFLTPFVVEYAKKLYITVEEVAVKDIILPGEIREIMNTVLIAEKKAQASVITRREEVASTRSLLNTARLMEENETLYRLKEMEYVERICEHVGSINLNGGEGVLSQLTSALIGGRKDKKD